MKRYDIDSLDNRDLDLLLAFDARIGPLLETYFRPVVRGLERIPTGPALYVGNHNGATLSPDTFVFCHRLLRERRVADVPFGLAHEVALSVPLMHQLMVPLGAVRAAHDTAQRLFEAGHKALVYPGGDVDSMRAWSERKRVLFAGRRGYVRLALRAGVPIVPLVSAGAHEVLVVLHHGRGIARRLPFAKRLRTEVWPLSLSIPWGLTFGPLPPFVPLPTRIHQEVLSPITFERTGEDAAADDLYVAECDFRIRAQMQQALDRLYEERDAAGSGGPASGTPD